MNIGEEIENIDVEKILDEYNAGQHDPRIDSLIAASGSRAYRFAVRKFYLAYRDQNTDHEKLWNEELKRTKNDDILKLEG